MYYKIVVVGYRNVTTLQQFYNTFLCLRSSTNRILDNNTFSINNTYTYSIYVS